MQHSRPSCRSTARRRKCISEEAGPCSKMHGSGGKDVRVADIARGCQVDAASATPKINLTLRAWRCRGDDWATPPFRLADCAPFNVLGVYARRSHDLASLRLLPSRPLNSSLVALCALFALLCLCLPPAHVAFRSPTPWLRPHLPVRPRLRPLPALLLYWHDRIARHFYPSARYLAHRAMGELTRCSGAPAG
jgi:hypothetical protein